MDLNNRQRVTYLIKLLESSRSRCIAEHSKLGDALTEIKRDDPEVYAMIYWHDLNGKTWNQTFYKVCPDLLYSQPDTFCKKKVAAYLQKKGFTE